jgi:uncharacterized membrane protein YphA (DoxX/SURF4 family)
MYPEMQTERASLPLADGDTPIEHDAPTRWSPITRIAFRFGFAYFGLLYLELVLHLLPFPPFTQISWLYDAVRWKGVVWISKNLLHLSHDFATDFLNPANASKDTTYFWVLGLCYLVLAVAATVAWSLLDRKREQYTLLHRWFIVYLRLCLAAVLLPYGATKIFRVQFPPPSLSALMQTYGSSSLMQLMWIFMGASASYSFFGGLMEVVPGLLLVIPRLATLGALLSLAVVGNVLMMNFGYDVPVKLVLMNMTAVSIVILLPEFKRLADFFVFNRTVPAEPEKPLFQRRSLNRLAVVLQIAFGVVLLSYNLAHSYRVSSQMEASRKTPLYGIWMVDDYELNGEAKAPLTNDAHRWQSLIVNSGSEVVVHVMTGAAQVLYLHLDPARNSILLTQPGNPGWLAEFAYDNSRPGSLVLTGKMGGVPAVMRLHREDESKMPVNDPDIHWIHDAVK